jgi:hypothetical protein
VYGGIQVFLTSALVEGGWSASRSSRHTHGKSATVTHCIGDNAKTRIILHLQGLEPRNVGRPARSQSLYRLRYPGSICKWIYGHDIVQAVSRRLPTAAARVRSQVMSCGMYGGESGTWAGFRRVLRLSLPVLISSNAFTHLQCGAGIIGQLVSDVPSGALSPHPEGKKKKKKV